MKKSQPKKKRRPNKWVMPPLESIFDARDPEDPRLLTPEGFSTFGLRFQKAADAPYTKMNVQQLRLKALEGDGKALSQLRHQAHDSVLALNSIALEKPELLRAHAETLATWPVLHSRSPLVAKKNEEFFDVIHLGKMVATFGMDAAVVLTTDTQQKKWALNLFNLIFLLRGIYPHMQAMMRVGRPVQQQIGRPNDEWRLFHHCLLNEFLALNSAWWPLPHIRYTLDTAEQCVGLPALADNKAVTDQWWAVARELLMLNTDGNPQGVRELYEIGKKEAKRASGIRGDGTYHPNRMRDNIHTKILKDLKEEFELIPRAFFKATAEGKSTDKNVARDWIKNLESETACVEQTMLEAEATAKEVGNAVAQYHSIQTEIAELAERVKQTRTEVVPRGTLVELKRHIEKMVALTEIMWRYQ